MPQQNSPIPGKRKVRIVTNLLTKAVKLWLRTQVTQVEELRVEMLAGDRQLLSGSIPEVSVYASHAVYQGLHLTQVNLVAQNIRVNTASVLKGKSVQLLEIVPVFGELIQEEEDINASLSSSLLLAALNDALLQLLPEICLNSKYITWEKIKFYSQQLILFGTSILQGKTVPIEICVNLELLSNHELQLTLIESKSNVGSWIEGSKQQRIDLGSDVDIQKLNLTNGKLVCQGRINVNP